MELNLCNIGSEEIPALFTKSIDGKVPRVGATQKALDLIAELQAKNGPLLFHQSGGCCDGSAPMCFPIDGFRIGSRDVCLGHLSGNPFYISGSQFESWKHTQLIIDVVPGRGSSFSLEIPLGVRFLTRSRVFTQLELQNLTPL